LTSTSGPLQIAADHQTLERRKKLWLLTACIVFLGILWLCYWLFYGRYHEWTDDAYANGNMININSVIPGAVVAFYADDTDLVREGEVLVRLDSTNYQIAYERELATLAQTVLQVRQLYDNVEVALAAVEFAKTALSRAEYDYENRLKVVSSGAIAREVFVHSEDDLLQAIALLKQAEYNLKVALDARGNTPLLDHPLLSQQKANVRQAFYNLSHCTIYAPATGYVAQRMVNVGEWLTPTTKVMAVIPKDYVWVDANYKETQLTSMRIGQPATVTFDLYGSKAEYSGKVLGIASGSGSVFSIIPPQNATGNWIKIVQRLPVRISLDPETVKQFPTRLGISAEVTVDITNQDLPMLAQVPPTKPVGTTNVFKLSFAKVDAIIEKIISEHLDG
jgi:membrane fusion protein (multidrug efflux system)